MNMFISYNYVYMCIYIYMEYVCTYMALYGLIVHLDCTIIHMHSILGILGSVQAT